MSTNRINPKAGWVRGVLPKEGNGRALCRQCQIEVPRGRRTFCSDLCVDQWKLQSDPGYVRTEVFKRDRGVCAICATDTMADPLAHVVRWRDRSRGTGRLWHADHIIPVIEGGGECGLDNYRTLCVACHRKETAALRKRLAQRKRENAFLRGLFGPGWEN